MTLSDPNTSPAETPQSHFCPDRHKTLLVLGWWITKPRFPHPLSTTPPAFAVLPAPWGHVLSAKVAKSRSPPQAMPLGAQVQGCRPPMADQNPEVRVQSVPGWCTDSTIIDHPETRTTSSLHTGSAPQARPGEGHPGVLEDQDTLQAVGFFLLSPRLLTQVTSKSHLQMGRNTAVLRVRDLAGAHTQDAGQAAPQQTSVSKRKRRAAGRQFIAVPQPCLRLHQQLIENDPVLSGTL